MTESNTPISQNPSASRGAQIAWGFLICATLYVCYFSHLGAIGFVGPDEPRYAWIARDIMETGDWVTPRLYGRPWFEKPPLFYWGAALSFKLFGVSEGAARLPSAICALLATLALAWLSWRLYGAETARWLLLLLPSTVGMIGFSHAAATDMPFSAMLTIAMVCAAEVLGLTRDENTPILPKTPWLALTLFGFFLGLAMLAKGPAAIILSGGAIFSWALFTKRWRDAFQLLHPVAIASFCVTSLPWYVLCARRNPDFFHVFFIEHNFKRFLTPEFQHIQPFWFYIPVLLVSFLPWTALLLWSSITGAVQLWRTRSAQHSTLFLLCWAGFCMVFFSISQSKLPGYILPAVPAIGVLMSDSCVTGALARRSFLRFASLLGALSFFCLSVLMRTSPLRFTRGNERLLLLAGIVFALLGLANLFCGVFSSKIGQSAGVALPSACAVLPVLIAFWLTDRIVTPYFHTDPSGRTIAHELQSRKTPLDKLAIGGMNRGMQYSLNFYLHKEISEWNKENSSKSYILTRMHTCRFLTPIPLSCESVPFDERATGVFLYYVVMPGSVSGSADGGQADKKE